MRKILPLICFLITSVCQAQETLFTIISVKGIVTLDGSAIACGQKVTAANLKLEIKEKDSYAILLTEKGFAFRLDSGKYSIEETFKSEYSNILRGHPSTKGAILRHEESPIKIMHIYLDRGKNFLFGDSLTVIARPFEKEVTKYRLLIMNFMAEASYDSTSTSHVYTAKVSDRYETFGGVIFQMKSNLRKVKSKEFLVRQLKPNDRLKIAYDFNCVREDNFITNQLSILAICEIHELYLDQVHHLYKLWMYSQKTGIKITHPYYIRLLEYYQVEKFLPKPRLGY